MLNFEEFPSTLVVFSMCLAQELGNAHTEAVWGPEQREKSAIMEMTLICDLEWESKNGV